MTISRDQTSPRKPLKTSAVAFLVGVSGETIREWARAGRVRARKTPGGQYLFEQDAVDTLIASMEAEGLPTPTEPTHVEAAAV